MSDELKPNVQRPATYTFEDDPSAGRLYYFALADRQSGPYKNQRHVDAIIDIAHDGTLAGVELIENMPPAPNVRPSPASADAGLLARPWRCAVTGNPAGTDTRMIGSPCDCQGCRADAAITRLEAENARLIAELAEARKELTAIKESEWRGSPRIYRAVERVARP